VPALVVVTGPPGAGKTTIAAAMRERFVLPLIAKDTLKETLGGALEIDDPAESRKLGVAVFELLSVIVHELLATGVSVICEGNFTAEGRLLRDLPPARIVQVHVSASPEVLRSRLLERGPHRHAVHYDARAADEIYALAAAGQWEPLPVAGELVRVDTTTWPALQPLLDRVGAAIERGTSRPA
jgi:predicted kinase